MHQQAIDLLDLAIAEDLGSGDITTQAIYTNKEKCEAKILAKANGVIAGIEVAEYILTKMVPDAKITNTKKDGGPVQYGNTIMLIEGNAGQLLSAERLLLNCMQRMSGIATNTFKMAQMMAHTKAILLDTRKTLAGHRYLDKWAVRLGNGQNHRMGLYDRYLIKENHIEVAGGILEALLSVKKHKASKKLGDDILVEIEVPNIEGLKTVLEANHEHGQIAQIVMLDNMTPAKMREAVKINEGRVKLEASGNINQHTIVAIAETGVDFISSGSITHSVAALDMTMLFSTIK
jgi:nicotinate-nucleotide pyrophosphorylase (carboxylating)